MSEPTAFHGAPGYTGLRAARRPPRTVGTRRAPASMRPSPSSTQPARTPRKAQAASSTGRLMLDKPRSNWLTAAMDTPAATATSFRLTPALMRASWNRRW